MTVTKNGVSFIVNSYQGNLFDKVFRAFVNGCVSFLTDSFWDNVNQNRWENDTFAVLDKFLDKNHTFLDVGAWIGPTMLYGSHLAKKTFAIEPDPVASLILQSNIELNPNLKPKITVFNGALSSQTGKVFITVRFNFGDSMSWTIKHNSSKSVLVPSLTFDDFMKKFHITGPVFINLDVEGAESIIMPSMTGYIGKQKPTMLVSFHPASFLDLEKDSKNIMNVVKLYKNIYTLKGTELTPEDTYNKLLRRRKFEIVLTDKKWGK